MSLFFLEQKAHNIDKLRETIKTGLEKRGNIMLSAILECVVITAEAVATVGGTIKTVIDIFEGK